MPPVGPAHSGPLRGHHRLPLPGPGALQGTCRLWALPLPPAPGAARVLSSAGTAGPAFLPWDAGLSAARGDPQRRASGCGRLRLVCPQPVAFLGGAFVRGGGRSLPRLLRCRAPRGSAGAAPESLPWCAVAGCGKLGTGILAEQVWRVQGEHPGSSSGAGGRGGCHLRGAPRPRV